MESKQTSTNDDQFHHDALREVGFQEAGGRKEMTSTEREVCLPESYGPIKMMENRKWPECGGYVHVSRRIRETNVQKDNSDLLFGI